jgi:hypothetical protein
VLTATHYSTLTSTDSTVINALPWLYVVAVIAGLLYARRLKLTRPVVYDSIAESSPYFIDDLETDSLKP